MMEEKEPYYPLHGCAFCKNLTDLQEKCCCLAKMSDMIEVTEPRLLKRSNLKKGERICPMHYERLKNGLIFGGERLTCCAPFHVGSHDRYLLRPVPRSWRHLFDTPNLRQRYLPSLQICTRCYKTMLDISLSKEPKDDCSEKSLSQFSTSANLYSSPRRWESAYSLHGWDSSASGSSLSSSSNRLFSASSSLLSLYESQREKLGHPKAIPGPIKRHFRYGNRTSTPESRIQSLRERGVLGSSSFSYKSRTDGDNPCFENLMHRSLKREASNASIQSEIVTSKFESPRALLLSRSNSDVAYRFGRQVRKISIASENESTTTQPDSLRDSSSSVGLDSDWESVSASMCFESNSEQGRSLTPTRDFACESEKAEAISPIHHDVESPSHRPLSITVQSIINPELKRSFCPEKNVTEQDCISLSAVSDASDVASEFKRTASDTSLNSQMSSHSVTSKSRLHSSTTKSSSDPHKRNTEMLPKSSLKHFSAQDYERVFDKLKRSAVYQDAYTAELIRLLCWNAQDGYIQVLAKTLADCIIRFALEDVQASKLAASIVDFTPETECRGKSSFKVKGKEPRETLCDSCGSQLQTNTDLTTFAELEAKQIMSNVLEEVYQGKLVMKNEPFKFKSEFFVKTENIPQKLRVEKSSPCKKKVISVSTSCEKSVKWLEEKQCFQTLLMVEFTESKDRMNQDCRVEVDGENLLLHSIHDRDFDHPDSKLVECIVDEIIPVTRSFSTSFIDTYEPSPNSRSKILGSLVRSYSFDSFFTLTCQITSDSLALNKAFTAVPCSRVKNPEGESEMFLSQSTTVERFSNEDDKQRLDGSNTGLNGSLNGFENLSISSGKSDFGSSSSLDDCDAIEAELLEQSKITDRPHFVSYKSRIEDKNDALPEKRVPFELKPDMISPPLQEEGEIDHDSQTSHEDEKPNAETTEQNDPTSSSSTFKSGSQEGKIEPPIGDGSNNQFETNPVPEGKKTSDAPVDGRKHGKAFDWYIGENTMEERRSTQLLRALSKAALLSKQPKRRREVRLRKSDEDPEDDDTADVISKAMGVFNSKSLFNMTSPEEGSGPNTRKRKIAIGLAVIVGFVGVVVFAGWEYYNSPAK